MIPKQTTSVLFLWIGDAKNRHLKSVKTVRPDYLYFVSESKDNHWREYHDEIADWLQSQLGVLYDAQTLKRIVIERGSDPSNYNANIIAEISKYLKELHGKHDQLEVTWDVTGAPNGAQQILSFVASLLSNSTTTMYIQTIQRASVNDPIFHAPLGSKYYKKHHKEQNGFADKSLAEWRKKESEDKGGEARRILCPILGFALLNDCSECDELIKRLSEQLMFINIPSSSDKPISTSDLLKRMIECNTDDEKRRSGEEIIHEAAIHRRKTKNKNKPSFEELLHSIKIWISTNLGELRDLGLVETYRIQKELMVVKTAAGDMFTPAVSNLYNDLSTSAICEVPSVK